MKQLTLSVIMSNYNHSRYLPGALSAILEQSYQPLELIIVDDCSTDNSIEVLESYAQKYPIIRLIRNSRNMGILHNVSMLLGLCRGDFVLGAAADDQVLPGLLEKSMGLLALHPEAGLCSALSLLIDEEGTTTGEYHTPPTISRAPCYLSPAQVCSTLRRYGDWFTGNTTIYRRDALLEIGGFLPELRSFCDGFASRVLALGWGACFIPEPLGAFRVMPGSYSSETRNDVKAFLDNMQLAEELMRTRYRNLVPQDYVSEFRRRYLYTAGVMSSRNAQVQQREHMDRLSTLIEDPGLVDRLLLAWSQASTNVVFGVTRLHLYLRLRRLSWPIIQRAFNAMMESRKRRRGTK